MKQPQSAFEKLLAVDPVAAKKLLEREACERSLYYFVQNAWEWFDPQPFCGGWHLEALCDHLEAVTRGEIKRLLVNVPPGTSKSSIVSVCWPAWTWAQREIDHLSGPQVQYMFSTYAQTLTERDSTKTRNLISSPWYQEHWGGRYRLVGDQNTKRKFANDKMGYRLATSVGGTATGDGGKVLVIDDPHNAAEANSEAKREEVIRWWTETMPTRLRDQENGAKVVIMQRLHQEDLSGYIIENDPHGEWVHLCLPMRYDSDPARHCRTVIGFEDPRTVEGELLCPQRYNEEALSSIEAELGIYGTAGQMQQCPVPKGGGIIKRDHWQLYPPEDWTEDEPLRFPPFEYIMASVDTAYSEKTTSDFSACTVWGVWRDRGNLPRILLIEAWKVRLDFNPLLEKIIDTAKRRRIDMLLIEAKASGLSVAQEIRRLCATEEFTVKTDNPGSLDKVARVYSIQPLFEKGVIYAPDRKYADMVISEFESFPKGKHDDLVDSATQALHWMRRAGIAMLGDEGARENTRANMYVSPTQQIYDV